MPNDIIKSMVEKPHPIYRQNRAYWDFLLQSYEGGFQYANAMITGKNDTSDYRSLMRYYVNGVEQSIQTMSSGNLFAHPKEKNEDYQRRLEMSYYYNFCAPIIDIYKNHLFKDTVMVDWKNIEADLEPRMEDIDNKGSSIEEFRRELAEYIQLYGHSYVVIDQPKADREIITRQDQIDEGLFPYLTIYSPQQVINWSLDRFGNPYWVLLYEEGDSNIDPEQYDPKKQERPNCYFRLWTRTDWYLYDADYERVEEGFHGLGFVPITCAYDKRSKKVKNFYGISSVADIAFIARDVYNSCSELRQILRDQTFAFLALQGTASEYSELTLGICKGLLYPEGRNAPEYVSPPADNAQMYFNHIDRQVAKIYQLAKLEGGSAKFEGQDAVEQSGVSKAWDFNETNSALSDKALNLEDAELRIWQQYAIIVGQNKFEGSVQYPNEFSVSSLMEDLNEAEKAARVQLGETFMKEVKKAIHKKKFPRADEKLLVQMEKELDVVQEEEKKANEMVRRFNFLDKNRNAIPSGE